MLAHTLHLLKQAQKGHYAVGHFNINDLEMTQAIVQAGVKLKSPLILATSEGAVEYAGIKYLYDMVTTAAEENKIPIALHLDHGKNMDIITKAIKLGYSSVMIDASHEKFEKNVKLTKKVVQIAHRKGISVEAELGTIGGAEDKVKSRNILYTDPYLAKEFVRRTGCDFLAVAIGTSHGAYKFSGKAKLRLDLLREIRAQVKVPLVLHGASGVSEKLVHLAEKYGATLEKMQGVPDAQVKQAVTLGICKVNTDTDLRLAFDAGVRKFVQQNKKDIDPRHILSEAKVMIQKVVEERIRLLGSKGKA